MCFSRADRLAERDRRDSSNDGGSMYPGGTTPVNRRDELLGARVDKVVAVGMDTSDSVPSIPSRNLEKKGEEEEGKEEEEEEEM